MGIKWHNEQHHKKSIRFIQHYHKGTSKNYVTARAGRGSTLLLHVVTHVEGGGGYFTK